MVRAHGRRAGISKVDDLESESLSTGSVNTVKFLSDYNTFQAAADDVPTGGTLVIDGAFDVANVGTASLTDPINIKGLGWYDNGSAEGSKITNTGPDTVESPVIEFTNGTPQGGHPMIRDLAILHEGGTSPAVRVNNHTRVGVIDCFIDLLGSGQAGIIYEGESYFSYVYRTHIAEFTDHGALVTGTSGGGFMHSFVDCHFNTSEGGGAAGLETRRPAVWVCGGEFSGSWDGSGGAGIRWNNKSSASKHGGVAIMTTHEQSDYGIDITGDTNKWRSIKAIGPYLSGSSGAAVDTGIRFDEARSCQLNWPSIPSSNELLETTGNDIFSTVQIGQQDLSGETVNVASGSEHPMLVVPEAVDNNALSVFPTDPNLYIKVAYNRNNNSPVWHDGNGWRSTSSTTFTP